MIILTARIVISVLIRLLYGRALGLTSTEAIRLIRDGEKEGKGVWRWGKREIIYLSLHCHHRNDFCIKMGGDESHFNVSVGSDGQSHN